MPVDYSKYPANWKTEIRPEILTRANNRCEMCGVLNHVTGYRDQWGNFHYHRKESGRHIIRIVLTVAHLNHDITDNRAENLAALCQRCHLLHDRDQHRATLRRNRLKSIDQEDLI